jgi:capsular exopolysaccharide synthesis family protein
MSIATSQLSQSQASSSPTSDLEACYQSLARRIRAALNGADATTQVIGVTSCNAGEGVSTVAANLAIGSTDVNEGATLLIDANVDRPSQAKAFGVDPSPGLADLLDGSAGLQECIAATAKPGLSVLSAGSKTHSVGLNSERGRQLLDLLKRDFKSIVIDLPPCGDGDEVPFAAHLDGVLLVVEAESARQQVVQRVKDNLARTGAKLLGAVLNKRRFHIPEWLYRKL